MTSPVLSATLFGAEDLRMVEGQLATLAPDMVRVRFGAGGICGSDMHYFRHGRTGTSSSSLLNSWPRDSR